VVHDPANLDLPPRSRALAGLASLMTEAPWTVDDEDLDRLRAALGSDEAAAQAVTIVAMFNHHTRVADGTGIEPDYVSPLPRIRVDMDREPLPRPDRASWRAAEKARLPLSLRPRTAEMVARWREYARTPSTALSARDRAVVGSVVTLHVCDAAGLDAWGDARPETDREAALARYAEKLTVTPWRMSDAELAPLRRHGFDDRGLLDVITLVGFQNLESRLRLALGREALA
jgi:alkylhydroperoxidase family enzyme